MQLNLKNLHTILLIFSLSSVIAYTNQKQNTTKENTTAVAIAAQPSKADTDINKNINNLANQTNNSLKLGIPIECNLGKDCFVLVYPDRDPSPNAIDFSCGTQTYNGHDGTDFGITDITAMTAGVKVKAAAAGKVIRLRDGVPDRRIENEKQAAEINNIGCGNAVILDHGNGWETFYCHLRQGSVTVKEGMQVEKGTVLGLVGLSGLTSFPHVHLGVRYQGKFVDPFVGITDKPGCNIARNPLWEKSLDYIPTGLIKAGFTSQKPNNINEIWEGKYVETNLTENIPMLIFWVHPYGILAGDIEHIRLIDPGNKEVINYKKPIKSPNRINWVNYVGKKNTPENPIAPGIWRGEYQLIRGDKVLIDIKREINLTRGN